MCPLNHRVPPATFGVRCGAVIGGRSSAGSDGVWIESGTTRIRPSKLDKKGKVEGEFFQQLPLLLTSYPPNVFVQVYSRCYTLWSVLGG